MKTAIDWALGMLSRFKLPPDGQRYMEELRLLRHNGVTEESMYCPCAGCNYVCSVPREDDDTPVICPHDSTPLLVMTWKQMSEKLCRSMGVMENVIKEQGIAFQHMQEQFNGLASNALDAANRMREAEREVMELQSRDDDMMFLRDNEREELERLREYFNSPLNRFTVRMHREIQNNAYNGGWEEWKPNIHILDCAVAHYWRKLQEAADKGNRLAVDEFAADIGNYMVKAIEVYGSPLQS